MRSIPSWPLLLIALAARLAAAADETWLELDALPRRYDLRLGDDGARRARIGWADGGGVAIGWRPAQPERRLDVGLVAGLAQRADRDVRLRTGDFALDLRWRLVAAAPRGVEVAPFARYGVAALVADDDRSRSALGLGSGGMIGVDARVVGDRVTAGLAVGYVAWRFSSASTRLAASGWEHGPDAALRLGWRW